MAATEVAPLAADTTASQVPAAITPLLDSLRSVLTQFANGITTPTVAFTDISKFGGESLDAWKAVIE